LDEVCGHGVGRRSPRRDGLLSEGCSKTNVGLHAGVGRAKTGGERGFEESCRPLGMKDCGWSAGSNGL
jgi:hypothetical protein